MGLTAGQADQIAKTIVAGLKGRNYTLNDIAMIVGAISTNVNEEKGKLEL